MDQPPTLTPLTLRIGDLELRTCDEDLLQCRTLVTLEINRWFKKDGADSHCYVLAMWRRNHREGDYSLEFVGDRPFSEDAATFWKLAKFGQEYLSKRPEAE